MVMHADHFDSLRSCIRVYTDHIEFMNGGAFPLPVKDILGRIYSKLRNPTIAKLFRFVGIAENAGYGMNKLVSWESLTGARPTIESDRTIAVVSFPLKSAIQRMAKDSTEVINSTVNSTVNTVESVEKLLKTDTRFSEIQKQIIIAILSNPNITINEIAILLERDRNAVNYQLRKIKEHILIDRIGSDKIGSWHIVYKQ